MAHLRSVGRVTRRKGGHAQCVGFPDLSSLTFRSVESQASSPQVAGTTLCSSGRDTDSSGVCLGIAQLPPRHVDGSTLSRASRDADLGALLS